MFKINNRSISDSECPYIIAELSANHSGSIEKAKMTIKAAKECGANAIKLQTYTADSMTIRSNNDDFKIKGGLWDGYSLYELYQEACTPYHWHKSLFEFANEIGITIFSTPFDEEAVDLLESLNTPAYKIASFELNDLPLIKYIAMKGKPILISTGMGHKEEIKDAVETAKEAGCSEILLFHCISSYPTPSKDSNIKMILKLKEEFDVQVGLSDHTLNNTSALAAVALGANAIEKHFILNRSDGGPDSSFSIEPSELKKLVRESKECWEALGSNDFKRPEIETRNKIFKRSLYFIKDIKKGDQITKENIKRIRPGYGLSPKYIDQIINKKVNKNIYRGDRVTWDVIEKG